MMATAKKKPSAKQIAARRKFARMAKSGELQKLAAAGRKKKARARKNQLGPAIVSGLGYAIGGKAVDAFEPVTGGPRKNRHPSKLKGRKAPKGFAMPKKKLTRADYNRAYKSHFGAARHKARKEAGFLGGRFSNPKGQHVASVGAKYQRMYERIVGSPAAKEKYGARLKEVAARTVKKMASEGVNPSEFYRQNPFFFSKKKYPVYGFSRYHKKTGLAMGKRKKFGHVTARTLFGARRKAARAEKAYRKKHSSLSFAKSKAPLFGVGTHKKVRKGRRGKRIGFVRSLFNPDPVEVFKEFRGKAPSGHIATAPMHGPEGKQIDVAELGKLREIRLASGKVFPFGNGARLCADRNKKLHIAGVRFRPLPQSHNAGPIASIVYKADKPHIERGSFDYEHKFGEEGGRRPDFVVDKEGYPYFSGGSYRITSAGIVN